MNCKTLTMDTKAQIWQAKKKVFDKERNTLENELANLLTWVCNKTFYHLLFSFWLITLVSSFKELY